MVGNTVIELNYGQVQHLSSVHLRCHNSVGFGISRSHLTDRSSHKRGRVRGGERGGRRGSRRAGRSKLNLMGWIRAGRPRLVRESGVTWNTRGTNKRTGTRTGADESTYVPPNNVIASHPGWYRWLMAKPSFPPWSSIPFPRFAPSLFA